MITQKKVIYLVWNICKSTHNKNNIKDEVVNGVNTFQSILTFTGNW